MLLLQPAAGGECRRRHSLFYLYGLISAYCAWSLYSPQMRIELLAIPSYSNPTFSKTFTEERLSGMTYASIL